MKLIARSRLNVTFLVVASLASPLLHPCISSGQNRSEPPHKQSVLLGIEIFKVNGICVPIAASMSAGDFFNGLSRKEIREGTKFFRGPEEVADYPDQLTVEVKARAVDCSRATDISSKSADSVAGGLRFELGWKSETADRIRPIQHFELKEFPPPLHPGVWTETERPPRFWVYTLKIDSRDVPLTDHLTLTIRTDTGMFIARMASHV